MGQFQICHLFYLPSSEFVGLPLVQLLLLLLMLLIFLLDFVLSFVFLPEAQYFNLGPIADDQLNDYALRAGVSTDVAQQRLVSLLA